MRRVSCGVIVTDGQQLLLGHASRSPRWDIPKGVAQAGENLSDAAIRELREETGLVVTPSELTYVGTHLYLPGKDLALFTWRLCEMPSLDSLHCASMIERAGYKAVPELDRFGIFPFDVALRMVGRNLARVLDALRGKVTIQG